MLLLPILEAVSMLVLINSKHLLLAYVLFSVLIAGLGAMLTLGARLSRRAALPQPPRPGEHQGMSLQHFEEHLVIEMV